MTQYEVIHIVLSYFVFVLFLVQKSYEEMVQLMIQLISQYQSAFVLNITTLLLSGCVSNILKVFFKIKLYCGYFILKFTYFQIFWQPFRWRINRDNFYCTYFKKCLYLFYEILVYRHTCKHLIISQNFKQTFYLTCFILHTPTFT